MLKECNDSKLLDRGVPEVYLGFYQMWQEMLDARTMDSYQYRVMNSLVILDELADVIQKTIDGLFTNNCNIESCQQEALSIIKNDHSLNKHMRPAACQLLFELGKTTKTSSAQKRLLHSIQLYAKQLKQDYMRNLVSDLQDAIDLHELDRVYEFASSIISQCIFDGWSSWGLLNLLRFFDNRIDMPDKAWELFTSTVLDESNHTFDVYIYMPFAPTKQISNEQVWNTVLSLGIEGMSYEQITRRHASIDTFRLALGRNHRYIHVQTLAKDAFSAAHKAIQQIICKINVASFFNLMTWDIGSINLIVIDATTGYVRRITTDELYKTYDYVDTSGRLFESTRTIFSSNTVEDNELVARMNGAFGYTNISRASLFQEEKYFGLWIALESLARTDIYTDIISCIKCTLPAALCLSYIYRLLRNFAEDCIRCDVDFNFSNHAIDIKQSTKRKMVSELICALKNESLYEELLTKCSGNSLLRYRCISIGELINNPSYARKRINDHYDRVCWHIQRLYRIRNEIAHSAYHEESSLLIYTEHLYDYLAVFLSEIVMCINQGRAKNIHQCFCCFQDSYELYRKYSDKDSLDSEFLDSTVYKTGIIDFYNV